MKKLLLASALALAPLTGCATVPTGPGQVADRTILDERVAIGAELAYKAARIACEFAVDAGIIAGPRATQFRQLNTQAYNAVLAVRAAYRAGNAQDFAVAVAEAQGLTNQLLTLTGRNN